MSAYIPLICHSELWSIFFEVTTNWRFLCVCVCVLPFKERSSPPSKMTHLLVSVRSFQAYPLIFIHRFGASPACVWFPYSLVFRLPLYSLGHSVSGETSPERAPAKASGTPESWKPAEPTPV